VLRSWHRRLEIRRRRREKPKVGRSPFAQRYHTHTPFGWDELPCFGLVLVYVTWVCAYALGRRPKMEKTRPLFFLTRGQNKNKNWLEFLFCFGFFSLPKSKERKKERKKVEKMFRVSGQFSRRRLNE
jgi:hypothetical protein